MRRGEGSSPHHHDQACPRTRILGPSGVLGTQTPHLGSVSLFPRFTQPKAWHYLLTSTLGLGHWTDGTEKLQTRFRTCTPPGAGPPLGPTPLPPPGLPFPGNWATIKTGRIGTSSIAVSEEGPGPSSGVSCPLFQWPLPVHSALLTASQDHQCACPLLGCTGPVSREKDIKWAGEEEGRVRATVVTGSSKWPVKPEVTNGLLDKDPGILHWAHQV